MTWLHYRDRWQANSVYYSHSDSYDGHDDDLVVSVNVCVYAFRTIDWTSSRALNSLPCATRLPAIHRKTHSVLWEDTAKEIRRSRTDGERSPSRPVSIFFCGRLSVHLSPLGQLLVIRVSWRHPTAERKRQASCKATIFPSVTYWPGLVELGSDFDDELQPKQFRKGLILWGLVCFGNGHGQSSITTRSIGRHPSGRHPQPREPISARISSYPN